MELNLVVVVIAIAIVVIWVVSLFSGKETKSVKRDIGRLIGTASERAVINMHKSSVTSDAEWINDLEEEFGMDAKEAIAQSKDIQAQLLEPITALKAKNEANRANTTTEENK